MTAQPARTLDPDAAPGWRAALAAADVAPRCGARCRTRDHAPCRSPAMANGRCRMHGGASSGARTPEGRARCRMARWRHGGRSAYWVGQRGLAMAVRREGRRPKALVDLELMARAAAARGIAPGLDREDLHRRPLATIEARKTLLAAQMLPATLPPMRKTTSHPMHPGIADEEGEPERHKGPEDGGHLANAPSTILAAVAEIDGPARGLGGRAGPRRPGAPPGFPAGPFRPRENMPHPPAGDCHRPGHGRMIS